MLDVGTQLRSYFDDVVERITEDDIRVRATTERGIPLQSRRWQLRPSAAAAIGFGIAMSVIGGVFVAHSWFVPEAGDAGGSGTATTTGPTESGDPWLLLMLMLGFGLLAFGIWSTRRSAGDMRHKGEGTMQTIEKPEATNGATEELTTLAKRARWLGWLAGILAATVLGLGAWLIADGSSGDDTGSLPSGAQAALDDYFAAWDTTDGDALLAATTETYTFTANGRVTSRSGQAAVLDVGTFFEFEVFSSTVTGDGPYYVGSAEQVRFSALGDFRAGQSIYKLEEVGGVWKVAQHTWLGDL